MVNMVTKTPETKGRGLLLILRFTGPLNSTWGRAPIKNNIISFRDEEPFVKQPQPAPILKKATAPTLEQQSLQRQPQDTTHPTPSKFNYDLQVSLSFHKTSYKMTIFSR